MNRLRRLSAERGQSLRLDNLRRGFATSGQLVAALDAFVVGDPLDGQLERVDDGPPCLWKF
jgi:hypothetical protein